MKHFFLILFILLLASLLLVLTNLGIALSVFLLGLAAAMIIQGKEQTAVLIIILIALLTGLLYHRQTIEFWSLLTSFVFGFLASQRLKALSSLLRLLVVGSIMATVSFFIYWQFDYSNFVLDSLVKKFFWFLVSVALFSFATYPVIQKVFLIFDGKKKNEEI